MPPREPYVPKPYIPPLVKTCLTLAFWCPPTLIAEWNADLISPAAAENRAAGIRTSAKAAAQRDRLHASHTGQKRTEETCSRISAGLKASAKAADQRQRLHTDPAICAKRAAANTGQKRSAETRERMRLAALARHARRRATDASTEGTHAT